MALFLYGLSFLFNFIYGVLLPIVPHLNEDVAGWAFTAFLLFKLIWFIPAGILSDKIGHKNALTFTLLLQTVALVLIAYFPHYPWLGRSLEGMALAQGTLSTFAFLRELTPSHHAFRGAVSKLLGLGGLGMIAGPTIGYQLIPYGPVNAILALSALSFLFLLIQLFFIKSTGKKIAEIAEQKQTGNFFWFAIGLTAAKALGVGWEPNLAWWAQSKMHFSAQIAGISFFILGISFVIGSLKPKTKLIPLVFLGFAGLEFSLTGSTWAWWPSLALVGLWYGIYVTVAVGRLGWDNPDKIGRHNSFWMLGTDLPMTFVPAILWVWREQEFTSYRIVLGVALLLISSFSLWRGLVRDSHVPTGNYQS